jgi:hypothetical protein
MDQPDALLTPLWDILMYTSRCSSRRVERDSPFKRSIGFGIRAHSSLGGIKTVLGMKEHFEPSPGKFSSY